MKLSVFLAILIIVLITASHSNSQERNPAALLGAGLLNVCTSADPEIMGFCHGYIQGVHDTWSDELCVPKSMTREDIAAALVDLLMSSVEVHELHASALVLAILKSSSQCE